MTMKRFYIFLLSLFLYPYFITSVGAGLYSDAFPEQLDIMPREVLLFDGMEQYAEFITVTRPFNGQRYRIRPGLGCLRALLDPHDDIALEIRGYGNFRISKKEGYPFLHITTKYHKVMCKVLEINPA